MKKMFIKMFAISALFTTFNANAQSQQNPSCIINVNGSPKKVHVWYTLNNKDTNNNWYVQISRNFENNISFVDESCNPFDFNQKIELLANTSRKVGMLVEFDRSFNSIYSFTAKKIDTDFYKPQGITDNPIRRKTCIITVAPYGARQMESSIVKFNNADCYATEYGTEMFFK